MQQNNGTNEKTFVNTIKKPIAYNLQNICSTANKYSSASHHEQKNKTTSQIKFLAVMIKQRITLVL